MSEYTIKCEDIMVMFKSLVSSTSQGNDNSVVTHILKVIQKRTNAVSEKDCGCHWGKV